MVDVSITSSTTEVLLGTEKIVEVILGVPGPAGADGVDGIDGADSPEFTHVQPIAAMVWTVDHNLGFWPDVIIYDEAGNEVGGSVTNPTVNRSTLVFSEALSGTARFS